SGVVHIQSAAELHRRRAKDRIQDTLHLGEVLEHHQNTDAKLANLGEQRFKGLIAVFARLVDQKDALPPLTLLNSDTLKRSAEHKGNHVPPEERTRVISKKQFAGVDEADTAAVHELEHVELVHRGREHSFESVSL